VSEQAKNRLVYPALARQYYNLSKHILSVEHRGYDCYYQLTKHIEGIGHNQIFITDNYIIREYYYELMKLVNCANPSSDEGYVKGPRLYVATDDLAIVPCSPTTLIKFSNRFETPFEDLKEKDVTIGTKDVINPIDLLLLYCFVVFEV